MHQSPDAGRSSLTSIRTDHDFLLTPCHIPFAALCGWVHQRQQQIIEFQSAQIETLLELHGRKLNLLTNEQRLMMEVNAFALGHKALQQGKVYQ